MSRRRPRRLDHPLRFSRLCVEKVWGGSALTRRLALDFPADRPLGEVWEVVDRASEFSTVADGPWAGAQLGDLVAENAWAILGSAPANATGRFPLLVKYIEAGDNLSIQVHPDAAAAARLGGGAEAKTEAWYILDALPGAVVWRGLRPGITREHLARHSTAEGCEKMLIAHEVQAGDCITIPAGTVHAIGAGVTLLEVQENSDTTYRIYDWGRRGLDGALRETHIEQALEAIHFDDSRDLQVRPSTSSESRRPDNAVTALARTRAFALDMLRVELEARLQAGPGFTIYCVVQGAGRLRCESGVYELPATATVLVPATVGDHVLESASEPFNVIRIISGATAERTP